MGRAAAAPSSIVSATMLKARIHASRVWVSNPSPRTAAIAAMRESPTVW
jgi:hypothetical protein